MTGYLLKKVTRFRAYQLGNPGSSFSYFDGSRFTLIEGRLTELSKPRVLKEMEICQADRVGCLHITSWDTDHCEHNELHEILTLLKPKKFEYPGYDPKTDTAKRCLTLIRGYQEHMKAHRLESKIVGITPDYVKSLNPGEQFGYKDIVYHPTYLSDSSNDNSTVQLFRSGCFNVASFGDVESNMISARLCNTKIFSSEVDVMILAHHGADNGFTTNRFLKMVKPTIAICSSNYDNQYEHPKPEIRELLQKHEIPIYTTKTGDVAVQSIFPHMNSYRVINLKADSTEISSVAEYRTKKSKKLLNNQDTVKNVYRTTTRTYPK
jgi:competence protein ComEC